jgi:hypothetical protein
MESKSDQPSAMREKFEKWAATLPKCLGYEGGCDGDLEGQAHEPKCPMFGKEFATHQDAFQAGWQAAQLSEAEPQPHYRRIEPSGERAHVPAEHVLLSKPKLSEAEIEDLARRGAQEVNEHERRNFAGRNLPPTLVHDIFAAILREALGGKK